MEQGVNAKSKRICKARKLDMEALKEDMNKYRDLYQYERAKKFKVSQNCIHKGLKRLGVSYKKTFKHPKATEEKRIFFKNRIEKYKLEDRVLSYIDESVFEFDMEEDIATQKWETGIMVLIIGMQKEEKM